MFRGYPSIQFSGTQSPFYTGAGTQYQRTNTGAYSYSHPFSGQSQWSRVLRFAGANMIFGADFLAEGQNNQSIPNPQRQGQVPITSQGPPQSSQFGVKINSGQTATFSWEHRGNVQRQSQSSPQFRWRWFLICKR